ncbi:response regulator transcription factor [Burkholderia pyrrocinia]|uniref:response regulator transcription factor n=1 Tax=Burkholderia pyrrocinia TaxID=60550 RepID=UPI00104E16DE|nr:response regulator transcription factor [Burkholderia pyrrocinia]TDA47886.1 response regulator transcription factor [Burkholderia pyrrocinia]
MKIRLILADDHPALLAGIRHELSAYNTFDIVGTARNSTELMALLANTSCDVLVTDYAMPGGQHGDGVNMLSILRRTYGDLKILVFTTIDNAAIAQKLSKMGIQGVLNKGDEVEHLVRAIHGAHVNAKFFYSPMLLARSETGDTDTPRFAEHAKALTTKEAEVMRLYLGGMSNDEIAKRLNRTKQTVSAQRLNAMKKLGIKSDLELSQYASEIGMTTSTDSSKPGS